ncbi:hypothetical protein [Pseudomonas sp. SST3]|uniref:hypothetical protein n=1 Tax=Pseudomonas sp. SST3 TaxID=2267882 RepID=UPI000E0178D2|nr:hypothetical protein [Pseudomonas sp. SST3]NKQ11612.1 hypothetical protein [Pseudomonas sp. SST3]
MITPALVILLIVIGWGAAAFAMLWGMLRIARYHHKPTPEAPHCRQRPTAKTTPGISVSLSA